MTEDAELFAASANLFKAAFVLWIRTGATVVVDGRLHPLIASIADAAGTLRDLAEDRPDLLTSYIPKENRSHD